MNNSPISTKPARQPILLLCPAEFSNGLTTYALSITCEKVMIYEACVGRIHGKFAQVGNPRLVCVESRERANEVAIISRVLNDQARKREDEFGTEFGTMCTFADLDKMTVGFERDILTDIAERSMRHLGYTFDVKILHSEVCLDYSLEGGVLKEENANEQESLIGRHATTL